MIPSAAGGTAAPPRLTAFPFWYLRHGQTDWNAQDLCQGRTDIPLNETGLQQARLAASLLRGTGIASIIASPLQRARITAEIAADQLGLPVTLDDCLMEVSFGAVEGEKMDARFHAWVDEKFTPEGAESFAALRMRAVSAINRLIANPAPVLFVGHGAFFRALRSAMGLAPAVRLQNAVPLRCVPPQAAGQTWALIDPALAAHPSP